MHTGGRVRSRRAWLQDGRDAGHGWRAAGDLVRRDDELARGITVHLVVLLVAGLILLGAGVFTVLFDISGSTLTREPQITLDGAFYTGALSNLGALIWTVGVVLALVGWSTSAEPVERRMFIAAAAIGSVLLVDDFFLVHDWVATHNRILGRGLSAPYLVALVALVSGLLADDGRTRGVRSTHNADSFGWVGRAGPPPQRHRSAVGGRPEVPGHQHLGRGVGLAGSTMAFPTDAPSPPSRSRRARWLT